MRKRPLCFVCLLVILLQGGLLLFRSRVSLWEIPVSSLFHEGKEKSIVIEGQVYKKSNTSKIQILYLKDNSVKDSKIIIYDDNFTNISIGERITVRGTLSLFEKPRNPGNYDQALYYARQEIYGAVWCEEVFEISGEPNWLKENLYQLKMGWKKTLINCLGEKRGGIMSAILLGDKSEMNSDVKELYQNNGISHILAISGLHISFIGLGIYRLIRKTGLGFAPAGVLSILILTLYILMIGFSISALRAYIMLIIRIGADITGRVYDMLTATMLGAAITIIYQPLYLTDAGFYMSYGAILAILIVLPLFPKSIFSKCYASITINIVLFPFILWFYFVFPTYSLFLNILVIPCMSPILGLGLLGSGLMVVWKSAGGICLKICGWILGLFEQICGLGNKLPFAKLVLGKPEFYEIVLYYAVLIIIILVLQFYKKRKQWLWLILFLVAVYICYQPRGSLRITMLDVGQGDGIYICGPNGTNYFIDGGSSDVSEVGKYRMEPFLESQGVGSLDYVFITHGDLDHYSGIIEMLERQQLGIKIKNIVLPANYQHDTELMEVAELARNNDVNILRIDQGESLIEGKMKITCMQPSKEHTNLSGNAGSMILEIKFLNFSMLCTGDVEGKGEEILLSSVSRNNYDVLKVAHHGSKYSTNERLLKEISPEIALISAGINNQYGHPHNELLERLEGIGCRVYNTQENGAITLQTDGNSLTIW